MATLLQLDDNLVNGQTYTFAFICHNWLLNPSDQTIVNDIIGYAPDFIQSPSVTDFLGVYKVTFAYEGDGSDVVSDVQNSIMAAVLAGSGDQFSAGEVNQGNAIPAALQLQTGVTEATGAALGTASTVATQATQAVLQPASGAVNTALVGLLPLLIVVVLLILYVLPSLSKSLPKGSIG